MSVTLSVSLGRGRLEALQADLLVAPFFETDRPLRGAAARADWRTCGLLSEQIFAGRVRGAAGEAVLLPSAGRLAADRILALGLGPRPGFGARELAAAATLAGTRAVALRVAVVAMALPVELHSGIPAALGAVGVLRGFCEALRRRPAALRLLLVQGEGEANAVSLALAEAASGLSDAQLVVRLEAPRARRKRTEPGVPAGGRPGGADRQRPAPRPH